MTQQAAVCREPHSWVLVCQACGRKRVLELGADPAMKDFDRRPMHGRPWFAVKTYAEWWRREHEGCGQ